VKLLVPTPLRPRNLSATGFIVAGVVAGLSVASKGVVSWETLGGTVMAFALHGGPFFVAAFFASEWKVPPSTALLAIGSCVAELFVIEWVDSIPDNDGLAFLFVSPPAAAILCGFSIAMLRVAHNDAVDKARFDQSRAQDESSAQERRRPPGT
jgi:hypothetical protein